MINAGSKDGIKTGDSFEIIDKFGSDPVIDPDTGENLGSLDIVKGTVVADQVYPNMTIVEAPMKKVNTLNPYQGVLDNLGGFRTVHPDLNVDPTEITGGLPDASEEPIKVGDIVIKSN